MQHHCPARLTDSPIACHDEIVEISLDMGLHANAIFLELALQLNMGTDGSNDRFLELLSRQATSGQPTGQNIARSQTNHVLVHSM